MKQIDKVLTLLAFGERLERENAMTRGVQNITARIADLRKAGLQIETHYKEVSRYPRPTAVYTLPFEAVVLALRNNLIRYDCLRECYYLIDDARV